MRNFSRQSLMKKMMNNQQLEKRQTMSEMIEINIHFDQILHLPKSDYNPAMLAGLDNRGYVWTFDFATRKWTKLDIPTVKVIAKDNYNNNNQRNYQPRGRFNDGSVS
jgi:hypothetical protein